MAESKDPQIAAKMTLNEAVANEAWIDAAARKAVAEAEARAAYAQPYRDEFPKTCWWKLDEPGLVCILERGHDKGNHEKSAPTDGDVTSCGARKALNAR